jgi:hypothetical protein
MNFNKQTPVNDIITERLKHPQTDLLALNNVKTEVYASRASLNTINLNLRRPKTGSINVKN